MRNGATIFKLCAIVLLSPILFSCAGFPLARPDPVQVELYVDDYKPHLDRSKFKKYRGQVLVFESVSNTAPNTKGTYFIGGSYFSADKTITYKLFYGSWPQAVESFYRNAFQKAFADVGIDVREPIPIKNAPQLHLNIKFLTDVKAIVVFTLSRNGLLITQNEIIVSRKFTPTRAVPELEEQSFEFIDVIAAAILNHPDFKREFFSDKGRIT